MVANDNCSACEFQNGLASSRRYDENRLERNRKPLGRRVQHSNGWRGGRAASVLVEPKSELPASRRARIASAGSFLTRTDRNLQDTGLPGARNTSVYISHTYS